VTDELFEATIKHTKKDWQEQLTKQTDELNAKISDLNQMQ
jgi:hypothetical protein